MQSFTMNRINITVVKLKVAVVCVALKRTLFSQ